MHRPGWICLLRHRRGHTGINTTHLLAIRSRSWRLGVPRGTRCTPPWPARPGEPSPFSRARPLIMGELHTSGCLLSSGKYLSNTELRGPNFIGSARPTSPPGIPRQNGRRIGRVGVPLLSRPSSAFSVVLAGALASGRPHERDAVESGVGRPVAALGEPVSQLGGVASGEEMEVKRRCRASHFADDGPDGDGVLASRVQQVTGGGEQLLTQPRSVTTPSTRAARLTAAFSHAPPAR